ncbi:unnamed protein product [Knipowitschia caucasica]|uniref:Uncharacterized protein n=1 Tax=Knipowitschia caucasica TaxID=637954 RepID=A0AAV2MQI0_KNICA
MALAEVAYGLRAVPRLFEELQMPQCERKKRALNSLCDLLHDPERLYQAVTAGLVEQLSPLLQDPDSAVRSRTCDLLQLITTHSIGRGALLSSSLLGPLFLLLDDSDSQCRIAVHRVLNGLVLLPLGAEVLLSLVPKLMLKLRETDEELGGEEGSEEIGVKEEPKEIGVKAEPEEIRIIEEPAGVKEKPTEMGIKEETEEIGVKGEAEEIGVKEEPEEIGVKKEAENIVKEEPEEIGIKEETEEIGVKEEAEKIGIKEETEEIGVKGEAEEIGVKEEPEEIGVKKEAENIVKEEPEEIGIKEETEEIGVKEEAEKIGIKEETEEIGVKEEPEETGIREETEEIGVKGEAEEIGVKEEPEEIGVKEEPEEIGIREETEEIGVKEKAEEIGVKEEPEEIGVKKENVDIVKEEPEETGIREETEEIGFKEEAEEIGVKEQPEEIGIKEEYVAFEVKKESGEIGDIKGGKPVSEGNKELDPEEKEQEEELVLLLSTVTSCSRRNALPALASEGISLLHHKLKHRSARVRRQAAAAMLALSVPLEGKQQLCAQGVMSDLMTLLQDPDIEVRANAAGVCMNALIITAGKVQGLELGLIPLLLDIITAEELSPDPVDPVGPEQTQHRKTLVLFCLRALTALSEAPAARSLLQEERHRLENRRDTDSELRRATETALRLINWTP